MQLFIKRVHCIEETSGPASDEINMGGSITNPDGKVTTGINQFVVSNDFDEGESVDFGAGKLFGEWAIYVMNADGSDLSGPLTSGNAASWSPDGKKILFQTDRDGNFEIYVMNADGTEQTRLTDFHGRDLDADWSPDGRSIVFQRDIEPIEAAILQVFVMNADGTQVRPLTALPSENGHPGWGRERAVKPRHGGGNSR